MRSIDNLTIDDLCRQIVADRKKGIKSKFIDKACELCVKKNGPCKFENEKGEL